MIPDIFRVTDVHVIEHQNRRRKLFHFVRATNDTRKNCVEKQECQTEFWLISFVDNFSNMIWKDFLTWSLCECWHPPECQMYEIESFSRQGKVNLAKQKLKDERTNKEKAFVVFFSRPRSIETSEKREKSGTSVEEFVWIDTIYTGHVFFHNVHCSTNWKMANKDDKVWNFVFDVWQIQTKRKEVHPIRRPISGLDFMSCSKHPTKKATTNSEEQTREKVTKKVEGIICIIRIFHFIFFHFFFLGVQHRKKWDYQWESRNSIAWITRSRKPQKTWRRRSITKWIVADRVGMTTGF